MCVDKGTCLPELTRMIYFAIGLKANELKGFLFFLELGTELALISWNSMVFQRTLKHSARVSGVGVHTGKNITLTLNPHFPNQGIVFKRTDLKGSPEIPANYKNVLSTNHATTIGIDSATVSTVEHVLAALQGLGIDNALLEIDGPEVPILDGSSLEFCKVLFDAQVKIQSQPRVEIHLKRPVELKVAEKWAIAKPSSRFEVDATIEWDHPQIGYQSFHYIEDESSFAEIASARTFCLLKDVENLKRMGLAKGGSLESAVVLDHASVLNPDGLRYPDEFVRHKVLDAIGDFKLMGFPLRGYFRLHRGGHELHHLLLQEIFKDPLNYEWVATPQTPESEKSKTLGFVRAAYARIGIAATF